MKKQKNYGGSYGNKKLTITPLLVRFCEPCQDKGKKKESNLYKDEIGTNYKFAPAREQPPLARFCEPCQNKGKKKEGNL